MAIDIVNNGATLKITTAGVSRLINKMQIREISVIKTNIIKLDLGLGALHNVFISYPDVTSPVAATPEALRDAINIMLASATGSATEQNQLAELTQLQNINNGIASLTTSISSGGSGSGGTFDEPLIVDESNANVVYRGFASPGANVAAAVWAIQKTSFNGDITTTQWADGNKNLDNIWNNRATTQVYS